jgi:hypothetical protein
LDPDNSKNQQWFLPVVEAAYGHALNNDAKAHEGEATQSNFVLVVPVLLVEIWILQQNTQDFSVADPGCSEFFPSRIWIFPIPDPGSSTKNLSILTQKIVSKLPEIWSGLFIPHPDAGSGSEFFTHPVFRGQKSTGSRIRIGNTARLDCTSWSIHCKSGLLKVLKPDVFSDQNPWMSLLNWKARTYGMCCQYFEKLTGIAARF